MEITVAGSRIGSGVTPGRGKKCRGFGAAMELNADTIGSGKLRNELEP